MLSTKLNLLDAREPDLQAVSVAENAASADVILLYVAIVTIDRFFSGYP
jgi:hypothetical protein